MFLTMLNNAYLQLSAVNAVIYLLEIILIGYLASNNIKSLMGIIYFNPMVLFSILILILNVAFSKYDSDPVRLLKFLGYILISIYGYKLGKQDSFAVNRTLVNLIVFIPLLLVGLFDHTPIKNMYFPNSNNFVFWGLVVSLLFYLSGYNKGSKNIFIKSLLVFLMYVLVGSSLGVIVAFLLGVFVINIRNTKLMAIALLSCVAFIPIILYSQIPVVVRLRNTFEVFTLVDWKSMSNIETFLDLNLYDLNSGISTVEGERNDNTSAIWRLQQWINIIFSYFREWWYSIPFGLGDNYSTKVTGLPPHNDFLRILCEYGIFVFATMMSYVIKAMRVIRKEIIAYFLMAIFFYHLTENLIDTFPTCCIYYLILSYSYSSIINHNPNANPSSK